MEIAAFDATVTVVNRIVLVANQVRDATIFQCDLHGAHGVTKTANTVLGYFVHGIRIPPSSALGCRFKTFFCPGIFLSRH